VVMRIARRGLWFVCVMSLMFFTQWRIPLIGSVPWRRRFSSRSGRMSALPNELISRCIHSFSDLREIKRGHAANVHLRALP